MCPRNRDLLAGSWTPTSSMHLDDLSQAFHMLDRDGDGAIGFRDLSAFFNGCLRQSISHEEAASMISVADLNGDGAVGLDEFQHLMRVPEGAASLILKQQAAAQQAALQEVFDVLDVNKDGRLGRDDLREAMAMSGQSFSEQELDAMVQAAAGPGSEGGYRSAIDFEAFSKLMFAF
ncbi:hypothetical protein L7F22_059524 [Adiantum nelumboides]|nr:hypothetical protein [Adiantum nelumboides]